MKNAHKHLSKVDRKMAVLTKKIGPCAIPQKRDFDPYAGLMQSIVYQQLTGKAAATIYARVLDLFPGAKVPTPEQVLETSDQSFRAAGLSGNKTAAIKDLALRAQQGFVPSRSKILKMTNEEIITQLTAIRGIGPWTVEMLLIFSLGRPDVLPITDYGVRKGFAKVYGLKELPHPKELQKHGEKWAPFRSAAAWYLWRSLDLPDTKKVAAVKKKSKVTKPKKKAVTKRARK